MISADECVNHMGMKLHPAAVPKKEGAANQVYDSLYELCLDVVRTEGWSNVLYVERPAGSSLVQIIYRPNGDVSFDPPIVLTASEDRFRAGHISRLGVRNECRDFLNSRR